MFEYYFNKVFIIFNCDENYLKIFPYQVKDRVNAELTVSSDKIMLCYTTIPPTSNILKNLLVNSNYHYSYTNQEFNDKKEEMFAIFSTYVAPQIKEINHPSLLQEWKLNLDAAEYKNNMKANMYKPSEKKKFNYVDSDEHWPISIKKKN